uniref:Uncharacterized protein n=1 Tax=Timema shepardi TaxID=629360 RepID=A0A7R9ANU1_TIMSH|nr:unnamed protein product [Timema shepardi]
MIMNRSINGCLRIRDRISRRSEDSSIHLIASCAWSLSTMPKDRLQELRASAPADYYRDSQVTLVVDTSINADEKSITVFLAKKPGVLSSWFSTSESRSPQSELWTGVSGERTGVSSVRTGVSSERTGVSSVSGVRTGVSGVRTGVSGERTGVSSVRTGVSGERTGVSGVRTGVCVSRVIAVYRVRDKCWPK